MSSRTVAMAIAITATLAAQNGVWLIGHGRPALIGWPIVSPGDVVTLHLVGLPIDPDLINFSAKTTPWPTKVGDFEVLVRTGDGDFAPIPIKRTVVYLPCQSGPDCVITYATVQMPTDLYLSGGLFIDGFPTSYAIRYRGKTSTVFRLQVNQASPHLAYPCDYGCPPSISVDGRSVFERGVSLLPGDTVRVRAHGLGRTEPGVALGQPAPQGARARGGPFVRYSWILPDLRDEAPPAPLAVESAELVAGEIGLFEFPVRLPEPPAGVDSCSSGGRSNLRLLVGPDSAALCVKTE